MRLVPFVDPDNRAFWTGGAEGALLIQRCAACRLWIHPAVPVCRRCRSVEVAPERASGRGRVASKHPGEDIWYPLFRPAGSAG